MSAPRKRQRWVKIQEFYAHSAPINAASLGRKSCGVIATGADDGVVHVWKLGGTRPLMTLSGHTTEVDSVLFDAQEALVAAGSRGGTIKVWDLATSKLLRTLPGHKSSVRALDFHPYGDYFASGSADTQVKIFDVRKKGCMQTYRGHTAAVSAVKHSPDGRWIVSGDESGNVRVWDLTGGKLVHELRLPSSPRERVSSLDFHPIEFLLAVGGERGVSCFDMESFALVSSTPREAHTVRCVGFARDGRALLSASDGGLKSWSWENSTAACLGGIDVPWGPLPSAAGQSSSASAGGQQILTDLAEGSVDGTEVVGLTRRGTVLGIFVADLTALPPFDQPLPREDEHHEQQRSGQQNFQSLMDTLTPVKLESTVPPAAAQPLISASAADAASAYASNPHPSSSPSSKPGASVLSSPSSAFFEAHRAGAHGGGGEVLTPAGPNPFHQQQQQALASPSRGGAGGFVKPTASEVGAGNAFQSGAAAAAMQLPPSKFVTSSTSATAAATSSVAASSVAASSAAASSVAASAAPAAASAASSSSATPAAAAAASPDLSSLRQKVATEHPVMMRILRARLVELRKLQVHWSGADPRRAIDHLVRSADVPLSYDFLTFAEPSFQRGGMFTLDMAKDLLPLLKNLVGSKYENHAACGLRYVKICLEQFTQVILSCRSSSAAAVGVDLTRDARVSRANDCFVVLKSIYDAHIGALSKRTTQTGELARETRDLLETLLWTK